MSLASILDRVARQPAIPRRKKRLRPAYGIDAPYALVMHFAAVAVMVIGGLKIAIASGGVAPLLPALFVLPISASILYSTLRGKLVVWAGLLEKLAPRGDERILDLGCGRGAVL